VRPVFPNPSASKYSENKPAMYRVQKAKDLDDKAIATSSFASQLIPSAWRSLKPCQEGQQLPQSRLITKKKATQLYP